MSGNGYRGAGRSDELPEPLDPALLTALAELVDVRRDRGRHAAGRARVIATTASVRQSAALRGRAPNWRRRLAVFAFSLAGANLAVAGAVAGTAGAQPDSFLYGVKRAAEAAKLSLTFDPQEKALLQLQLADRRADEAAAMASSGHPRLAVDAARDATTLIQQASAALGPRPSAANAQALAHASAQALSRLRAVFAALENGSDPGAAEAARGLANAWSGAMGGGQGVGAGASTNNGGGNAGGGAAGAHGFGGSGNGNGPPATPPGRGSGPGSGAGGSGGHGHTGTTAP